MRSSALTVLLALAAVHVDAGDTIQSLAVDAATDTAYLCAATNLKAADVLYKVSLNGGKPSVAAASGQLPADFTKPSSPYGGGYKQTGCTWAASFAAGGSVYVPMKNINVPSSFGPSLVRVDAAALNTTGRLKLPTDPLYTAAAAGVVFVACWFNQGGSFLVRVDLATFKVTAKLNLETLGVGCAAGWRVAPAGVAALGGGAQVLLGLQCPSAEDATGRTSDGGGAKLLLLDGVTLAAVKGAEVDVGAGLYPPSLGWPISGGSVYMPTATAPGSFPGPIGSFTANLLEVAVAKTNITVMARGALTDPESGCLPSYRPSGCNFVPASGSPAGVGGLPLALLGGHKKRQRRLFAPAPATGKLFVGGASAPVFVPPGPGPRPTQPKPRAASLAVGPSSIGPLLVNNWTAVGALAPTQGIYQLFTSGDSGQLYGICEGVHLYTSDFLVAFGPDWVPSQAPTLLPVMPMD